MVNAVAERWGWSECETVRGIRRFNEGGIRRDKAGGVKKSDGLTVKATVNFDGSWGFVTINGKSYCKFGQKPRFGANVPKITVGFTFKLR